MSDANPYRPPEAESAGVNTTMTAGDGDLIANGRGVEAGHGWQWIADGFALFKKKPGHWIGMIVIALVLVILLSLVPILGALATWLLYPVLGAGFMIACRTLDHSGEMELGTLFAGFKQNTGDLIVVGVLYLAGMLVAMIPALVLAGTVFFKFMTGMGGDAVAVTKSMGTLAVAMLLYLALAIPVVMAAWFAPALVVFHNRKPVEAMKASFHACIKNIIPYIVYGIILMLLAILAAIPFGLGLLVLMPVAIASVYAAYRDIFLDTR